MALVFKKYDTLKINGKNDAFKDTVYEGEDFVVEIKVMGVKRMREIQERFKTYDVDNEKELVDELGEIQGMFKEVFVSTNIDVLDENDNKIDPSDKQFFEIIVDQYPQWCLCVVKAAMGAEKLLRDMREESKNS